MRYIVGLDIGGTKCAVVLAEFGCDINIIDKIKFATDSRNGFEYTKKKLFQAVYDIVARNHLNISDISAIGVSCGGPLDSRSGVILCPPNLPGWVNIPFVKILEEEFKIPAFLQNDANACALVEWKMGAGKGTSNMMFLTMGTGMGGEVGHIRIEEDGPLGFGKYGSFEGFCSGGGIARLAQDIARKALENNKPLAWAADEKQLEQLDTKQLAESAKAGDKDAIEVFRIVGEKLGKGIAYFIDILNPEVIVIGSIFGRCEKLLRPSMEEVIEKECIPYSKSVCRIVPAGTGERIGDYASIMVAAYGMGLSFEKPDHPEVHKIYEELFVRYPILKNNRKSIWKAYLLMKQTYQNNAKVLCCGNGGSAADADHIVGELMKGFEKKRPINNLSFKGLHEDAEEEKIKLAYLKEHLQGALPAIALTQHTALSSAFSNDVAADMTFAQQVYGYGNKEDTLIAISTSGNSRNVENAVWLAKMRGLRTIGLTGERKSALSKLCDVTIQVPGESTAQIQELHLPVYHTLCAMVEAEFFEE